MTLIYNDTQKIGMYELCKDVVTVLGLHIVPFSTYLNQQ